MKTFQKAFSLILLKQLFFLDYFFLFNHGYGDPANFYLSKDVWWETLEEKSRDIQKIVKDLLVFIYNLL